MAVVIEASGGGRGDMVDMGEGSEQRWRTVVDGGDGLSLGWWCKWHGRQEWRDFRRFRMAVGD